MCYLVVFYHINTILYATAECPLGRDEVAAAVRKAAAGAPVRTNPRLYYIILYYII